MNEKTLLGIDCNGAEKKNGVVIIKKSAENPKFPAIEIRKLRVNTLKMNKEQFCKLIGCSKASIDSWESGRRQPTKAHIKLMKLLRLHLIQPSTLELL